MTNDIADFSNSSFTYWTTFFWHRTLRKSEKIGRVTPRLVVLLWVGIGVCQNVCAVRYCRLTTTLSVHGSKYLYFSSRYTKFLCVAETVSLKLFIIGVSNGTVSFLVLDLYTIGWRGRYITYVEQAKIMKGYCRNLFQGNSPKFQWRDSGSHKQPSFVITGTPTEIRTDGSKKSVSLQVLMPSKRDVAEFWWVRILWHNYFLMWTC
jgi:hypothetical protein